MVNGPHTGRRHKGPGYGAFAVLAFVFGLSHQHQLDFSISCADCRPGAPPTWPVIGQGPAPGCQSGCLPARCLHQSRGQQFFNISARSTMRMHGISSRGNDRQSSAWPKGRREIEITYTALPLSGPRCICATGVMSSPAFAALNADPQVMAHFPAPLSCSDSDALATPGSARRLG